MDIVSCSVDECYKPAKTRGWCMRHYQQQYRGLPLTQRVETTNCKHCATSFPTGRGKIYCSQRCREIAKHLDSARVACSSCAGPTGWKVGQVDAATCNPCRRANWSHGTVKGYREKGCRCGECRRWNADARNEYNARRKSGELVMTPCSEDGCERGAESRGWCTMHYRRWARTQGMENPPSAAWSDTRRSNHHARRARLNGARNSDKVLIAALIERDNLVCAWCTEPIDLNLTYPNRYSKSVDHTLPLSRGGEHTLENTTLMHLTCNLSKGAKVPTLQR